MKATERQTKFMLLLMKQTGYKFLEELLPKDKEEARAFISKLVEHRNKIRLFDQDIHGASGWLGRDPDPRPNPSYVLHHGMHIRDYDED